MRDAKDSESTDALCAEDSCHWDGTYECTMAAEQVRCNCLIGYHGPVCEIGHVYDVYPLLCIQ